MFNINLSIAHILLRTHETKSRRGVRRDGVSARREGWRRSRNPPSCPAPICSYELPARNGLHGSASVQNVALLRNMLRDSETSTTRSNGYGPRPAKSCGTRTTGGSLVASRMSRKYGSPEPSAQPPKGMNPKGTTEVPG